jgi:tetratricopeptide (TPR) repeat protein
MPTIVARLILLASLSAGLGILGCAKFRSSQPELHTIQAAKRADAAAAQKLIDSGLKHLRKGKLDKAEADFLSAIALNSRSGPAHNNLGKVYVLLESHYLAATEFDQAADLMPTRFEPRVNLATLFEDLRRFDEAEEQIAMADTLVPGHPLVISVWARIRAKQELWDGQTEMLLQEVLYRDDRSDWKNWAALLLSQNSFTHDDVLLLNAETAPTFDLRMIPPEELGNPPRVEPMQGDFESQGDGDLPVPLESLPLELSPAIRR